MNNITLTPTQAAALDTLIRFARGQAEASMCVLMGWAGTGKTTLVARLLRDLVESGYGPIAVAAPTNKAVRVLRGKIEEAGLAVPDAPLELGGRGTGGAVEFGSIHSLLGLQLTELEDGGQECRQARDSSLHEFSLVVVDECSMIGDDLFRRVATAKRRTLILWVGDPAQLPPIQAGEAISPTFSQVQLQVVLGEVVRQAADNPIIRLSMEIRAGIEAGVKMDQRSIAAVLPPLPAKAALVTGTHYDLMDIALYEIQEGRDARIIAYTNQAVQGYNMAMHEAVHGYTRRPYVVGERVIVHSQCEALTCDGEGRPMGTKEVLITSEELTVSGVETAEHPHWPGIPADLYTLEQDDGGQVAVFVATQQDALDRAVGDAFREWREVKARAEEAAQSGRHREAGELRDQAKSHSGKAWALKRAFAPLRHAYALTAHKSQGSTFDTAVVDLEDLAKMRSAFAFNRALYVAATRASQHLAIVA